MPLNETPHENFLRTPLCYELQEFLCHSKVITVK